MVFPLFFVFVFVSFCLCFLLYFALLLFSLWGFSGACVGLACVWDFGGGALESWLGVSFVVVFCCVYFADFDCFCVLLLCYCFVDACFCMCLFVFAFLFLLCCIVVDVVACFASSFVASCVLFLYCDLHFVSFVFIVFALLLFALFLVFSSSCCPFLLFVGSLTS